MLETFTRDPEYADLAPKPRKPLVVASGKSCGSCSGSGQQCHRCKQGQTLANPYPEWAAKEN